MKTISISVVVFLLGVLLNVSCSKNASISTTENSLTTEKRIDDPKTPAILKLDKNAGFEAMILPNATEQFGAKSVAVVSLGFETASDAKLTTIEYETEKGVKSYMTYVLVGKQPIRAGGIVLQTGKAYTVDCYGSCDCRERWYPGTGAIECTCNDCMMKIVQISREL